MLALKKTNWASKDSSMLLEDDENRIYVLSNGSLHVKRFQFVNWHFPMNFTSKI
uniref:Uncharacterized protein n=1 Tax=Nelumbo nucifera TaxID=4432 RepID=A0A822Y9J6_NELNU|nr:TPA_asm: hypothetical protein HUJ06_029407 [Nelumbo nucifera]